MKKYNVYSSMLGGFIAMDFNTESEAQAFIDNYHCEVEKRCLRIT